MPQNAPGASPLEQTAIRLLVSRYGIHPHETSVSSHNSFNSFVRVEADSATFAVRIGDGLRIHPDGNERIESAWLTALGRSGDFVVPHPVEALDGSTVQTYPHGTPPSSRVCSVFTWVEGDPPGTTVDGSQARDLGRLAARLHLHARRFTSSVSLGPVRFDRAVYFPEKDLLESDTSPDPGLLSVARDRAQTVIDSLWQDPPHPPHVLHGDLGVHNVLSRPDGLAPIDFQDLRFGFDVQDLAITIADLDRRHPEMIGAFVDGFESVAPWPSHTAESWRMLIAARSLNIINLTLHLRRPSWEALVERHLDIVRACVTGAWRHPRISP